MGDSGSGSGANMPTPEAINYKELTFDELKGMVDDMSSFGTKLSGLSIVTKALMKLSHKSTIEEIKRRRDDPYTSEIDKRRYDELLELASKEQPGLVETIFNKITGKEPEGPPVRTQEQTDALYAQLDKMTKAYTPDPQTANDRTTPGVNEQGVDAADFGVMQDKYDNIARIEQELKSQPRPKDYDTSSTTDTQPTPHNQLLHNQLLHNKEIALEMQVEVLEKPLKHLKTILLNLNLLLEMLLLYKEQRVL